MKFAWMHPSTKAFNSKNASAPEYDTATDVHHDADSDCSSPHTRAMVA